MDDYSVLAQRISVSVPEVRGCLILSRDGMVLGAYPDEDEGLAKDAWLRFVALGEPDKSFVEFADQTWAFVRRGAYAAFAVAEAGVRPGVMVDQLEQAMLTAEEGRSRRDTLRVPDAANAPSGKPRTSLHPGGGKDGKERKGKDRDAEAPAEVSAEAVAEAAPRGAWSRGTPTMANDGNAGASAETVAPVAAVESAGAVDVSADGPVESPKTAEPAAEPEAATALKREPQKLIGMGSDGDDEPAEVDRVLLAKEFSGLLQMDSGDDEGSS
ncbi:MAG: hypothetical protein ABI572_06765 [Actinomycetota bacterium]